MRKRRTESRVVEAARTSSPSESVLVCVLVLMVAVCYVNTLTQPFIFDDEPAIVNNPAVHSLAGVLSQGANLPTSGRPLVTLSFALNYGLGGLDVRGYHSTNVLLHLCTTLLLFGIARRTLSKGCVRDIVGPQASVLAFAVSALWAVHPLATEAVNYVTQRTELLMALMFMATLFASSRSHVSANRGRWQAVAVTTCGLGMACKESMVVAPLIVVIFDALFEFDSLTAAIRARWRLYLALAATWGVLLVLNVSGPRAGSVGFGAGVDSWTYLLNQSQMLVRYLRLVIWPVGLVINYGRPVPLSIAAVSQNIVLIVGLLAAVCVALSRRHPAGFAGAWLFLTLAPTSSIVPIVTEVGAERRMYLPLMACVSVVVLAAYRAVLRFERVLAMRLATAMCLIVALALGAITVVRNKEYASPLTLAEGTLTHWPSPTAHAMLGAELAGAGRDDEALPHLRAGAAGEPRAQYNIGTTLFNLKDYDGAARELQAFVDAYPMREEVPAARLALGRSLSAQGKWQQASDEFERALVMTPNARATRDLFAEAVLNYGLSLARAGQFAAAVTALRRAVELNVGNVTARHDLALALFDSGDIDGSLREARMTLGMNPRHAESFALIGKGLARHGQLDAAAEEMRRALALAPGDQDMQHDLAVILNARASSAKGAAHE